MNKTTFDQMPPLVANEGGQVRISFDAVAVEIAGENGGEPRTAYQAYCVRVGHPATRAKLIDAIVSAAYPADAMQAIINNKLLEAPGENPEHEAEYVAMQQWRAKAKAVAAQVLDAMQ